MNEELFLFPWFQTENLEQMFPQFPKAIHVFKLKQHTLGSPFLDDKLY